MSGRTGLFIIGGTLLIASWADLLLRIDTVRSVVGYVALVLTGGIP